MAVRVLDIQVCEAEAIPPDVGMAGVRSHRAQRHPAVVGHDIHGCGLVTDLSDQTR